MSGIYVVRLVGAPEASTTLLGGKGKALADLLDRGFEVPATAVITSTAYRNFVRDSGLGRYVSALGELDPDDADVDTAFLASPIQQDVADAVLETAASLAGDSTIAVRSSATAEDMSAASFAGQYRSFLEVDPRDVLDKVRLVWASLWHRAPRSYRQHRGIAEDELGMAVVLMRMVPAQLAGVAFTVDPTADHEEEHLRVEAVEGLGEALVSGAASPDSYVIARSEARSLPAPLDLVARRAIAIERDFGEPQDVEWAWDGEAVWIIQSRPITTEPTATTDGFDTPLDDHRRYTTNGIAEMLPGVLPPLVWEVSSYLVEEAFNRTFDSLGALPRSGVEPHEIVKRIRGRAVLDLDALAAVAAALPGGSADELERQYVGTSDVEDRVHEADPSTGGWRGFIHDFRVVGAQRRALRDAEIAAQAYVEMDPVQIDLEVMESGELLSYRMRLIDLACRGMAAELSVAAAAVAAYRRLELLLLRYLDERAAASYVQRVTTGAASSPLFAAAGAVLAGFERDQVNELPRSWRDARATLVRKGEATAIRAFELLLDRADSMAVFAGPTWREEPDRLWGLCLAHSKRGAAFAEDQAQTAIGELEDALAASPTWVRTRRLTAQVIDVRMRLLRRLIDDTRDLLHRRELVKQTVLDLGGRVRDVHLEVGGRLVSDGLLERRSDVDFLSSHEIAAALAGRGLAPHTVQRRRRHHEQCTLDEALPAVFLGTPGLVRTPVAEGDLLEGWGASGGRFTGRVRVVADPTLAVVENDDVLVARTTDASWSPLFLSAGAIVVEEGGPLSHAAIVARELGLPAVMNIPGIVKRLADVEPGTRVTVDGDDGIVVIHEEEAA